MKSFLIVALILTYFLFGCDRLPKLGPAIDGENKLASASQEDCGFVQNSYGQRVSWKQSLPVKIYIDPGFPAEYETTLREAARKWEGVVGRTLFLFERTSASSTVARDNRNVAYWETKWVDSDMNLQGVSTLSWYQNQLTEADLRVNAQNFNYYVDNNTSGRDVHLPSLLVHELGHILGLKHVNGSSVMLTMLDYLVKRDLPSAEDKAHIKCEYN